MHHRYKYNMVQTLQVPTYIILIKTISTPTVEEKRITKINRIKQFCTICILFRYNVYELNVSIFLFLLFGYCLFE